MIEASTATCRITEYAPEFESAWDAAVATASNGTVLHSRRFLNYHGDRFADRSLLLRDAAGDQVRAVFPAAVHPRDSTIVASHPGSTFGGLLTSRIDVLEYDGMFAQVCDTYRTQGFAFLHVKTTPSFIGNPASEIPTHHGMRHAKVLRADLWNAVELDRDFKFSSTRRSDVKAARRKGLVVRGAVGTHDWQAFHDLLATNLRDRHGTTPVHNPGELRDLDRRLGAASNLTLCESASGDLLAGIWLLDYGHRVLHTQYICSNAAGRAVHAVDLVLSDAIAAAQASDYRIFSLGTNTMPDGWTVNSDLMRYKLRFGAGAFLHPTFEYRL